MFVLKPSLASKSALTVPKPFRIMRFNLMETRASLSLYLESYNKRSPNNRKKAPYSSQQKLVSFLFEVSLIQRKVPLLTIYPRCLAILLPLIGIKKYLCLEEKHKNKIQSSTISELVKFHTYVLIINGLEFD